MKTKLFVICLFLFSVSLSSCDKKEGEGKDLYEKSADGEASNSEAVKAPTSTTSITFEEMEHDFGTIDEGIISSYTFKFKNTGNAPLVISDAKASCGCTVPAWTKEPVMPGEEGKIDVKYNSSGKAGETVSKTVTVFANTEPSTTQLTIKAKVRSKGGSPIK